MGGWGVQKNPEYVIKSDLKDKMLYCPNEFVHDCRAREQDNEVHYLPIPKTIPHTARATSFSVITVVCYPL